MARPGTIDYRKWDAMAAEISDDDDPPPTPFPLPRPQDDAMMDETEEVDEMDAQEEEREHLELAPPKKRRTGTCSHCTKADADKRCARCQSAWFCNRTCQAAAWPTHSLHCFAKSETASWWGVLDTTRQGRARDIIALHQQRLEFRRTVAATQAQRREAASAAALRAAALRAQQTGKGADGKQSGKGSDEKEETCAVCQCEFTVRGDSGEGISCLSSHYLCSECTGVFVQSILSNLEASFPPKCSMCRAEIPCETFERQLNAQQLEIWQEFITVRALSENERMHKCERCGYFGESLPQSPCNSKNWKLTCVRVCG